MHTDKYMAVKDELWIHPRKIIKVEFWKQCDLCDFSVPLEISTSDTEQRAVIEGTSLCLWTVLFLWVTDLSGQAGCILKHSTSTIISRSAHTPCTLLRYLACLHGSTTDFAQDGMKDKRGPPASLNQARHKPAADATCLSQVLLCTAKQQRYTAPVCFQNVVFLLHLGSGGMSTASLECKQFTSVKCNLSLPHVHFLFWGISWAEAVSSAKYIHVRWMTAAFVC